MMTIETAAPADAEEILALQKLAYQSEARLYNDWTIPPLTQTLESLRDELCSSTVLKALLDARIVGSVRARVTGEACAIGRLVVHPDHKGRGIGSALLKRIESMFDGVARYELFTGSRSDGNLRLYQRHGYAIVRVQDVSPSLSMTFLEKAAARR
jgi:GNAT superfamily N-acetyltransferase